MTFLAEYQCIDCEHIFEHMTHQENDLIGCPECGSTKVTQVMGGHPTTCHDPAVLKETLQKRSADHSKPLIAEKIKQHNDKLEKAKKQLS